MAAAARRRASRKFPGARQRACSLVRRVDEKVARVEIDLDLVADLGLGLAGLMDIDAAAVGETQAQTRNRTQVTLGQPSAARGPQPLAGRTARGTSAGASGLTATTLEPVQGSERGGGMRF